MNVEQGGSRWVYGLGGFWMGIVQGVFCVGVGQFILDGYGA